MSLGILCCLISFLPGTPGEGQELFRDLSFQGGLELSAVRSNQRPLVVGTLFEDPTRKPLWRLAQWGTRFSFEGVAEDDAPAALRRLENAGKAIALGPHGLATCAQQGDGILMALRGGAEYEDKLRVAGQAWPHLLLEQYLAKRPRLASLEKLAFQLDFKLEACQATVKEGLDPGLHTAQVSAYWTIKNMNQASADYQDMIWFGLPVFDVRYPVPPAYAAVDGGKEDATGKFIYVVDGKEFYSGSVQDGKWHSIDCDLLPYIQQALERAQDQGYLKSTRFSDLQAESFNLGWEVTGPYDCGIRFRALSLKAQLKE